MTRTSRLCYNTPIRRQPFRANLVQSGAEYPITLRGECGIAGGCPGLANVRCKAVAKQSGRRCGRYAEHNQEYCLYHGGRHIPERVLILSGGRYSEAIGNELLRDKYKRLRKDDDLTQQTDDLALLRAMCEVVVERATQSEKFSADHIAAVTTMLEKVDRLVSSISEREVRNKLVVRMADIGKLIDSVVEIVGKYVKDPGTMMLIGKELTAIPVVDSANEAGTVL